MRKRSKSSDYKYINGQRYYLVGSTHSRDDAVKAAKHYREKGSKIRILKSKTPYFKYDIWELK